MYLSRDRLMAFGIGPGDCINYREFVANWLKTPEVLVLDTGIPNSSSNALGQHFRQIRSLRPGVVPRPVIAVHHATPSRLSNVKDKKPFALV